MRHSTSLVTIAEALRRVFLLASYSTPRQCFPSTRSPPTIQSQCPKLFHQFSHLPQQRRHASTSRKGGYMTSIDDDEADRPRADRPPRDEEIKAFKIYLVRPEDNRLTDPIPTFDVLQSRQRDEKGRPTQFLQEVAPVNVEAGRFHPICRIIDKKLAREKESAKRKAGKEKKLQTKQLEVNWTISDNDLSHRLGRLKEFLEKGWRIEILFGAKRKGWMNRREASKEDIKRVLERIRKAVGEIDGAKEWKGMQGTEGGEAVLSFEGIAKK